MNNSKSKNQTSSGYLHSGYAQSLAEFGEPRELANCGGWILERQIPNTQYLDAMGCYPFFTCQEWDKLTQDLKEIEDEIVSILLVTDPFGKFDTGNLSNYFQDFFIPYKEHYVTDLQIPINEILSKNNRRNTRKALSSIHVETCVKPSQHLSDWFDLYNNLIVKHNIQGIRKFSISSFQKQLNLPGAIIFTALNENKIIGAHIWFQQGQIAYSHLSAYSPQGYELGASYALQWSAHMYFADKVRWLNQGAGVGRDGLDGLSQFKNIWSTKTKPVYLCGKIFNREIYSKIVETLRKKSTDYFPAYRDGEFS